ncbi:hypothetical protein NYE69_11700 [Paenibacillus sp. FSL R5-0527]|nr:hypothetical protein BK140_05925 [Paenibacillus macerans]
MTGRFILYHNGHFRLENEVACCSRLTGDSLKLLGLIMNRVNTAQAQLPTKVALPRLLLKRVFGNKDDKTVKNYAKRLMEYGFIETFSMQGGDRGEFVFSITDRPENNPFVFLSHAENEVIANTELYKGQKADSLLQAFTAAVKVVEHNYAARLKSAAESHRETILTAYRNYLSEVLQADGKAYVGTRQVKPKTNKAKPEPTETALPDDVQLWSYPEFESHFLSEYRKATGKKHRTKNREGKTVTDCIKELQHHYRDLDRAEQKPTMKKHIEAFFVCYDSKKLNPRAFFMADCDVLCKVEDYLKTGQKPIVYEERSIKDKKGMSQEEMRAQQVREAKQERKGLSLEALEQILGEGN